MEEVWNLEIQFFFTHYVNFALIVKPIVKEILVDGLMRKNDYLIG